MPAVRDLVGSSTVAAPSGIWLVLLLIFWFLPYILGGRALPRQTRPFLIFILVAGLSSTLSFFLLLPTFKEASLFKSILQGMITLFIGASFYLVVTTWCMLETRVSFLLRWLNYGGLVNVFWALAQAVAWFSQLSYPAWMWDVQAILSPGPLYRQRVSGMALEPSWLAHELNILFLPYWLAASINRYSAHRWRIFGLTMENILLAGGMASLFFSFSRVGWLAFLLSFIYLIIRYAGRLIDYLVCKILRNDQTKKQPGAWREKGIRLVFVLAILGILAGILAGGMLTAGKMDPRLAHLMQPSTWKANNVLWYAAKLQFGERVVYWAAGWNIFNRYPWLGVGIGAAGFLFPDELPAFGWTMPEVRDLMIRESTIPNIKNLWVRLLAETGITGFIVFCAWLLVMATSAWYLRRQKAALAKTAGYAGLFSLLALLLEGFSVDSFALPYFWICAGLVTGVSYIFASNENKLLQE